jgi:SAM-dependent methyltransferase
MSRIVLEPLEKSTLADWFQSEVGRYVLEWERKQIDSAVEDIFGFHAAQLGVPDIDFLSANRMPMRFSIDADRVAAVQAEPAHLPIASQSLDLLVLPHVLEFCRDPHQVLREVERVLMPEGQVVIAGFNPLSLWGMSRLARKRAHDWPWRGEFIGLLRLRDWLKLLGFELNGGKFGCYAPPFRQLRWLSRFRFMESAGDRWWPIMGGVYVVRAVKRVAGMRIVTPAWRTRRAQVRSLAAVARRDGWASGTNGRVPTGPVLRLVGGEGLQPAGAPSMAPHPHRSNDADDAS